MGLFNLEEKWGLLFGFGEEVFVYRN
jgi:hypothetical protein